MASQLFLVTGQVIDSTEQGIPRLRVEAWANINQTETKLGSDDTDEDGRFIIDIDLKQFGIQDPPDTTFKVFRDEELLDTSSDSVSWNSNSQEDITIYVLPPNVRTGKDRIKARQVLKAADFLRQSNFSGFLTQTRKKASTNWEFVTGMLSNAFNNMDFKPVAVDDPPVGEIIGQDTNVATRNLASREIKVVKVSDYNPDLNRASLSTLLAFPAQLRAGQSVELHQDSQGRVRYYSVIKEQGSGQPSGQPGATPSNADIAKLQEQLRVTSDSVAKKDQQISQLQEQLKVLQQDQNDIKEMLKKFNNPGGSEKPPK